MKHKIKSSVNILLLTTLTTLLWCIPMIGNAQNKDKWEAPLSADSLQNQLKNDEKATKEGKIIFQQSCVICHGNSGKGDGLAGAALNPKPTNLTLPEIKELTDGNLFWKISEGRSPMPGYKDVLPEADRWKLVNYIRTLKKIKN